ncbi:MAG: fucose isomerase, partial [Acidobacteria bacterium]|nr:fucose isomerase [Acidobacteriota bacterium]
MLEHLASRRIKVGVLDFGDGRAFLQEPLAPVNRQFRDLLVSRLEADGFEVVPGDDVIWQNEIAVRNGRALMAAGVDAVIFNFSVWAWPQYARVAAQFCPKPVVMFSNINPQYPGL